MGVSILADVCSQPSIRSVYQNNEGKCRKELEKIYKAAKREKAFNDLNMYLKKAYLVCRAKGMDSASACKTWPQPPCGRQIRKTEEQIDSEILGTLRNLSDERYQMKGARKPAGMKTRAKKQMTADVCAQPSVSSTFENKGQCQTEADAALSREEREWSFSGLTYYLKAAFLECLLRPEHIQDHCERMINNPCK